MPTFLHEQESKSPAGASPGADLEAKTDSRCREYGVNTRQLLLDSRVRGNDGRVVRQAHHERLTGYRIPGNIPFMPRIIFAIPPLENCFIIFCVCSN